MSKENNHTRTYRKLAQEIKTLLDRQGYPSKSSRYPLHLIYDTILDMRTSYVKRQKVSRQGIGQQNVQTISCIKLEEVNTNICPCQPPAGCSWSRSTKPIPKSIFITSVTNSNAAFKANYVEWSHIKNKITSRSFRKDSRYYTFLDSGEGSYLYLFNDDFLENVSISGIWENPNHAAYFTSCEKETEIQKFLRCNPYDTPLYMDGEIIDIVFKMTFDFLSRTTQVSLPDIKDNSIEDVAGINPKV